MQTEIKSESRRASERNRASIVSSRRGHARRRCLILILLSYVPDRRGLPDRWSMERAKGPFDLQRAVDEEDDGDSGAGLRAGVRSRKIDQRRRAAAVAASAFRVLSFSRLSVAPYVPFYLSPFPSAFLFLARKLTCRGDAKRLGQARSALPGASRPIP